MRLGVAPLVEAADVEVIASNEAEYGYADDVIKEGIGLLAKTEGIIADPVYEGRAIRGLRDLIAANRFDEADNVLLMHLGGTPAIHAYAEQFGEVVLTPFNA